MKTKVLISWAVTAQLICVFVFAYAKIRFSHDAAHLIFSLNYHVGKTQSYEECTCGFFNYSNVYNTHKFIFHMTRFTFKILNLLLSLFSIIIALVECVHNWNRS